MGVFVNGGDEVGAFTREVGSEIVKVGAIAWEVGSEITKVRAIISQVRSLTTKLSAFATIRHANPKQKAPLEELSSDSVCHSTRFRSISSDLVHPISILQYNQINKL